MPPRGGAAGSASGAPSIGSNGGSNSAETNRSVFTDFNSALSKVIGARIKAISKLPSLTFEGTLLAACSLTNLIAIKSAPSLENVSSGQDSIASADASAGDSVVSTNTTTKNNVNSSSCNNLGGTVMCGEFHIIPISSITSFQLLSLPSKVEKNSGIFPFVLPPVDFQQIRNREKNLIRKMKEQEATRGKGVSKEGQEIFDSLYRTLPTRWHEQSIIVNDAVIIQPPYKPESCKAEDGKKSSLVHVKKILEAYFARSYGPSGSPSTVVSSPQATVGTDTPPQSTATTTSIITSAATTTSSNRPSPVLHLAKNLNKQQPSPGPASTGPTSAVSGITPSTNPSQSPAPQKVTSSASVPRKGG